MLRPLAGVGYDGGLSQPLSIHAPMSVWPRRLPLVARELRQKAFRVEKSAKSCMAAARFIVDTRRPGAAGRSSMTRYLHKPTDTMLRHF